jgi:hypothetical protein
MTPRCLLILTQFLVLHACSQPNYAKKYPSQLALSEKTGIELLVIIAAEDITHSSAQRLKTYLAGASFPDDSINQPQPKGKTVEIPGISFIVPSEKKFDLIDLINKRISYRGYQAFVSDKSYNEKGHVTISVVKAENKYNALRLQQTNGINYGISTDSLITMLMAFDTKYPFEIVGADFDWCELRLKNDPGNWIDLAKEVLKICPTDEVTAEQFARTLKSDARYIFLWWD